MKHFKILVILLIILSFYVVANAEEAPKLRVAVLPFEARAGVEEADAISLGDKFRSELVKTQKFLVLERERTVEVVTEQILNQTGVTDPEYVVEAGKILNVEKMITGSIGRIGETYTINILLVDVETSQIDKSFSRDYVGNIERISPILKQIAWEVAELKIKGISKTPLYILGGTCLASIGTSVYSYFMAEDSYDKYRESTALTDIKKYKDDTKKYDNITLYSGIAAAGTGALYFLYRQMYYNSLKPVSFTTNIYMPNDHTFGIAVNQKF